MLVPRGPRYQWGQPVQAGVDIWNDGSYPDALPDALLVAMGMPGEIVQVGMHADSGVPVYLVEFHGGQIIGCLEEELTAC